MIRPVTVRCTRESGDRPPPGVSLVACRYERHISVPGRGQGDGAVVGEGALHRAVRIYIDHHAGGPRIGGDQGVVDHQVEGWFQRLWDDAEDYDLAAIYRERFAEYPPYLIYLRALWERYRPSAIGLVTLTWLA